MPSHFVAFGRSPGLPGSYHKVPITPFEVRRFCKNDGEGFWSLVQGDHASLVACETLRVSVPDMTDKPPYSQNPGAPSIGDQVLVIMPPEDFIPLPQLNVNTEAPIPPCDLEIWTRTA